MPSSSDKESGNVVSPSSSSSSYWWILAIIPLLVAAILAGLELFTETSVDDGATPGLDFGTGNMFDKIATRYDLINRVLAMNMDIGWRRTMTHKIGELLREDDDQVASTAAPWKILDVATGTADVALQLVEDLSAYSKHRPVVLGLDPSENMLAVGRQKIENRKLGSHIYLQTADARDLSSFYQDTKGQSQKFDAATAAFGIRNVVPHREKALCEIHKLLKPNGVLAILEFSNPSYETDGILGAAAGVFIQHIVPLVGGLLSGGAKKEYRHLQNSIREFPAPEEFKHQLQTLECPLREDDEDAYFYVGHYDMQDVVHMNFGSVQLYIGRAVIRKKKHSDNVKADAKLPPIGAME